MVILINLVQKAGEDILEWMCWLQIEIYGSLLKFVVTPSGCSSLRPF